MMLFALYCALFVLPFGSFAMEPAPDAPIAEDSVHIFVTTLADDPGQASPSLCKIFAHDGNPLSAQDRERLGLEDDALFFSTATSQTGQTKQAPLAEGGSSRFEEPDQNRDRREDRDRDRVWDAENGDSDTDGDRGGTKEDGEKSDGADSLVASPIADPPCACSLRAALVLAHTLPTAAYVVIRLPSGTIFLQAQLPTITREISIKGVTPEVGGASQADNDDDAYLVEDTCLKTLHRRLPCRDPRRGQPKAPEGVMYPLCSAIHGQDRHRAIVFDPPRLLTSPNKDVLPYVLTLEHMHLLHCHAGLGAGPDPSGHGGAVRVLEQGQMRAFNVELSDNSAELNGGAVQVHEGRGDFYQCTCQYNDAKQCGGPLCDVAVSKSDHLPPTLSRHNSVTESGVFFDQVFCTFTRKAKALGWGLISIPTRTGGCDHWHLDYHSHHITMPLISPAPPNPANPLHRSVSVHPLYWLMM